MCKHKTGKLETLLYYKNKLMKIQSILYITRRQNHKYLRLYKCNTQFQTRKSYNKRQRDQTQEKEYYTTCHYIVSETC